MKVNDWLNANKLSLNVKKTNFVLFRSYQKKIEFPLKLELNHQYLQQSSCVKYLGVMIDEHLNWKKHIVHVSSKIKQSIGILSKLRHYMPVKTLVNLYYALVYPYLTYSVVAWGNTYDSIVKPITTLQKRSIRIITFADFRDHSNPLFLRLQILKFKDVVFHQTAIFMHDFHHGNLPNAFESFFTLVCKRHNYNTRLASCKSNYSLPSAKTNYGKFNVRFSATKVWNSLDEKLRCLSRKSFKTALKTQLIDSYNSV